MGFGYLVFGCMCLVPAALSFFYSVPVACLLFAIGCYRLRRVNIPFGNAFHWACILGGVSLVAIILRLIPATQGVAHFAEALCYGVLLMLDFRMLTGLEWVAEETGMMKLKYKAFRNKIFVCIHLIPAFFLTLLDGISIEGFLATTLTAFNIAIPLVGIVVMILNIFATHTAYMYICMPEDVDMPQKPSRFAFINRHRARVAQREALEQAELEAETEARRKAYRQKQSRKRKGK